jgi:UDP-N-acetylmuramyl pentapeptide phosphotransferase/UDP-N-acetylglucosamine-1-phosphate transferase
VGKFNEQVWGDSPERHHRNYFTLGGVILLLGCLGVAFLVRAEERHRRRVSMACLRVSSWLLLLPLAGYGLIVVGASGLSNFPQ